MGQLESISVIERVLETRYPELKAKILELFHKSNSPLPQGVSVDCELEMSGDCYGIDTIWKIKGGMNSRIPGLMITVKAETIDIDAGVIKFDLSFIPRMHVDFLPALLKEI